MGREGGKEGGARAAAGRGSGSPVGAHLGAKMDVLLRAHLVLPGSHGGVPADARRELTGGQEGNEHLSLPGAGEIAQW